MFSGPFLKRFFAKWVRHRCHDALGSTSEMACWMPSWVWLVIRNTPVSPRAFKSWKKPFHDALDSAVATCMPSISRYPSALTPVASSTEHVTTRPPSRTVIVSASHDTKAYPPGSSGRFLKSATMSSSSSAMRETCDFDMLAIPNVATRSFILRVETPLR